MLELLVYARYDALEVNVLVPKKRGTGYLKTPLYHNANALSSLAYEIGYDIYGLDGSLDIQTGFIGRDQRDALLEKIMPLLAQHYNMTWRLVEDDEYWSKHPIGLNI